MKMISKKFDGDKKFVWVRNGKHLYGDDIIATVVGWYGGKCAWCGIADPRILTIDHVYPKKHPKRLADRLHGLDLHKWIIRNVVHGDKDRTAFRVLCRNCNHLAYISDQQNPGNITWGSTQAE